MQVEVVVGKRRATPSRVPFSFAVMSWLLITRVRLMMMRMMLLMMVMGLMARSDAL